MIDLSQFLSDHDMDVWDGVREGVQSDLSCSL